MSGGGVFLKGEWLRVGSKVTILRQGYLGMCGNFKGKLKNGKLLVQVLDGTGSLGTTRLYLTASEIRRCGQNE